jgi:hypothetical protein
MSVYNVALRNGMPVGGLIVGARVKEYTATVMLTVNGVLLALLECYFLVFHRKVAAL